jgi:glucosylceramidase
MVTIHSETKEITRSGQYWAFAHFSRNIRRGAKRFESSGTVQGVDHVAFENPDGQRVLVLANTGELKRVRVKLAGKVAELALPPDSVSTLYWS